MCIVFNAAEASVCGWPLEGHVGEQRHAVAAAKSTFKKQEAQSSVCMWCLAPRTPLSLKVMWISSGVTLLRQQKQGRPPTNGAQQDHWSVPMTPAGETLRSVSGANHLTAGALVLAGHADQHCGSKCTDITKVEFNAIRHSSKHSPVQGWFFGGQEGHRVCDQPSTGPDASQQRQRLVEAGRSQQKCSA